MHTDIVLRFYAEVLGFGHLHYGLWHDEPLTLDGLKAAQERYTRFLVAWIPPAVRSVLDVGCGMGGNALTLRASGYDVEGLAPDSHQQEIFVRRTALPFHLSRFEEFRPPRRYDLVLMSESAQYIALDRLFPQARTCAPGGYLLIADYFTRFKDGTIRTYSGHLLSAVDEEAAREGFVLLRHEDITDRVARTLDLARHVADRYLLPVADLVAGSLAQHRPWVYRIGRRLLRRRIQRILGLRELLDSAEFRRVKCYRVLLYRAP